MWVPLSEDQVLEMIDNAEWLMPPPVKAFWDKIKVKPQKWQLPPIGNYGGGFWVVAIIGQDCIYYNDIEEGFNTSPWEHLGQIQEYQCSQSDLNSFMESFRQDFIAAMFSEQE